MALNRSLSSYIHAGPSCRHRLAASTAQATRAQRRYISSHSYEDQESYLTTLPDNTLDSHLLKQDPAGRIRFLNPVDKHSWFTNRHRRIAHRVQASFPEATFETHLLPFWTVCHTAAYELVFYERTSGRTNPGFTDYVDIGYSVSAVGKDHWSSGLVLMDDTRSIVTNIAKGHNLYQEIAQDRNRTAKIFCEQPYPLLASDEWDPTVTEPFKTGYPRFGARDIQTIMKLCKERDMPYLEDDNVRPLIDVKGDVHTFAIPTYRIAYKVKLPDGRLAYVDGSQTTPAHSLLLPEGGIRMMPPWNPEMKGVSVQCMRFHSRFTKETSPGGDKTFDSLVDNEKMRSTVYNCIQNAVTPLGWMDQNIIPAVLEVGPTAFNLGLYSMMWVQGQGGQDMESGRPKYSSPRIRDHLQRQGAARATSETADTVEQVVPRVSLLRAAIPKKSLPGTAEKPQPQTQKKDPNAPPTKRFSGLPPRRPLPAHLRPSPRSMTEPIRDPLKAYQTLNVDANGSFLDERWESQVNATLKNSRNTLSKMYALDYLYGAGQNTMSSEINWAYDLVKTLDLRLKYHEMRDG